jgi:integrase
MLRKLTEAGKGRTAAKLRSYVCAAYALAIKAETAPTAPASMIGFRIEANPALTIAALTEFNGKRERALSEPELRAYWSALRGIEGVASDALQLAVILGGQRPAQLLRVKITDIDVHGRTIKLFDLKGKRKQPRVHTLPISDLGLPMSNDCLHAARSSARSGCSPRTGVRRCGPRPSAYWSRALSNN